MKAEIDAARYARDALGGVRRRRQGCPAGLGSYVDWRDKLDAQARRGHDVDQCDQGVEFGMGFELAARRSSEVQDEILSENGRLARNSNRLGDSKAG